MANDCSTTYKIVGETTELQAIYQVLNTLREQKLISIKQQNYGTRKTN